MSETLHSSRSSTDRQQGGVLALLRAAVTGGEQDFTRGPIGRAVLLLAVPMVLELAMQSLFAICDVFFVARLGTDAVAAVGLTEAVATLLYSVAGGLGMATTAMVARRVGEGDRPAAAAAGAQAILLGVATSAAFAIPGAVLAPQLLALMGGSPELVAGGTGFTRVLFGGSTTIFMLFLINSIFRGAGDAHIAMRALWLANGLNLVLDPCLIFGLGPFPELGLTGAAVATTIGRGVGVCYQLAALTGPRCRTPVDRAALRLRAAVMLRLMRLSLGGVGQFVIAHSSWIVLMAIVGRFGSSAVAGYTIAIRVIIVALLPSWGIANAAATLVGQNLGAGQPDRAAASAWRAALYNALFLAAVAAAFIAAADALVGLFSSDPDTLRHGAAALRIISYGYVFYAYGMVVVQAFNGAGDTTTPTVINLVCYWLLQIPMAFVLATATSLGTTGVFVAVTVAESLLAVVGVFAFRRGRWRTRVV